MGPDHLPGADPQKKSSAGSDPETSRNFFGHLDPPPVEPDNFDLAIASLTEQVDQKRRLAAEARDELKKAMAALGCSRRDAVLAVLRDRITTARTFGKWNDRWVFHPSATMSEPEKAVCHLTDFGDMDPDHLAWIYNKASLHGVDSYFNRARRRLSLLERGIGSQGNAGRI